MTGVLNDSTIVYTSRDEVTSLLSTQGVDNHLDDDDDGVIAPGNPLDILEANEEQWLDDAIEEATDQINLYALFHHTEEQLCASRWIRRKASYLAAHILSHRRGNPGVYCDQVCKIEEELKQIKDGSLIIPRAPRRVMGGPIMSNLTVDRRYRCEKLRVQREISVGLQTSRQHIDYYCSCGTNGRDYQRVTGVVGSGEPPEEDGIDFMGIGDTFIVQ